MPRTRTADRWPTHPIELAAQIVLCATHLGTAFVGLLGLLVMPSPSVTSGLTGGWVYVWSSLLIVCGLLSLLFRLQRDWVGEAICLFVTAGAVALWGALTVWATLSSGEGGALQIGSRLINGAGFLIGLGLTELAWVRLDRRTKAGVIQAVTDVLKQRGGSTGG